MRGKRLYQTNKTHTEDTDPYLGVIWIQKIKRKIKFSLIKMSYIRYFATYKVLTDTQLSIYSRVRHITQSK